jgi:biotin carboxyl carrier protein
MKLIVLRNGREHEVRVERRDGAYEVELGDRSFKVDSVRTNGMVRSLLIGGRQFEVAVTRQDGGRYQVSAQGTLEELEVLDPLTYLASQGAAGEKSRGGLRVDAYMPGRVVRLLVAEGDMVEKGQGLVVLEAMKMENEIEAERSGRIARVFVEEGQAVEGGDALFGLE